MPINPNNLSEMQEAYFEEKRRCGALLATLAERDREIERLRLAVETAEEGLGSVLDRTKRWAANMRLPEPQEFDWRAVRDVFDDMYDAYCNTTGALAGALSTAQAKLREAGKHINGLLEVVALPDDYIEAALGFDPDTVIHNAGEFADSLAADEPEPAPPEGEPDNDAAMWERTANYWFDAAYRAMGKTPPRLCGKTVIPTMYQDGKFGPGHLERVREVMVAMSTDEHDGWPSAYWIEAVCAALKGGEGEA